MDDKEGTVEAVEALLLEHTNEINSRFYKNINPEVAFGVERFVIDRMYHLPKLLEEVSLTHISDSIYIISSEQKDSSGNSIKLEHRFQATTKEEAAKLYEKISQKLAGVQQKIWLACWRLGNQLKLFTYTCDLTDLMKLTYPERNGYFSVLDKLDFYENLKSIEQTKFVFSKPYTKGKKKLVLSYTIPMLSIPVQLGENDKYPQKITISLKAFNPYPSSEKILNVAAEIKHKTLELHADDTQLATWIQVRKSQRQKEEYLQVNLSFLLKLAGLERTALSNKSEAKKLLRKKLQRYADKGIIVSFSEKIQNQVQLKVR